MFLAELLAFLAFLGISVTPPEPVVAAVPVRMVMPVSIESDDVFVIPAGRVVCGETVVEEWPDGRREPVEVRLVWPNKDCPVEGLGRALEHEWQHVRAALRGEPPDEHGLRRR